MSDAVMAATIAESASECQEPLATFFSAASNGLRQTRRVLGSKEILAELERRGVPKEDIAEAIGVHPSQVSRLYVEKGKPRQLKHDEAVKLVEEFELEETPEGLPLHPAMLRFVVHHVAAKFGLPLEPDDPRVRDVTADLAAFAVFVRDPDVKDLGDAALMYFRALRTRADNSAEDPPEKGPQPNR